MNYEIMQKLFDVFPEGFVNSEIEFIADERANIFLGLKDVETEKDLFKKIIHWFSRPAYKSEPFCTRKANDALHKKFLKAINTILNTNFNESEIEKIYTHLGNGVNEPLTEKFIDSGFDISVLENVSLR